MRRYALAGCWAWRLGLFLAALAIGAGPVSAATHYVAKDGTGAYTVIQDALDAAASGDTIRIGAGRYDDFVVHDPPFDGAAVIGFILQPDITIVGVDRDSVTIGPADFLPVFDGRNTFGFAVLEGGHGTNVSGMSIENLYIGIEVHEAMRISDTVSRNSTGMIALRDAEGVVIEDSRFTWTAANGIVDAIASPIGRSAEGTTVRNCIFIGEAGNGLLLDNGGGSSIENCYFEGMTIGVTLLRSSTAPVLILHSRFVQNRNAGIAVSEGSDAVINDCVISDSLHRGIYIRRLGSKARIDRTSVRGGDLGALVMTGVVDVVVRESDIFNEDGPRVLHEVSVDDAIQADLRYNYWGSQDSTEIASWIDDGADDPPGGCEFWYCPRDTVDFWPVLDRSVPTAKKSVGGMKGRFRGGQ